VKLLLLGVLLCYVAVSAANSLVMGTSQRASELALLRLVGTTRRQLLWMLGGRHRVPNRQRDRRGDRRAHPRRPQRRPHRHPDAVRATTGRRRPACRVAALAMTAILTPTRLALRANPAEAIAIREEAATTSTTPHHRDRVHPPTDQTCVNNAVLSMSTSLDEFIAGPNTPAALACGSVPACQPGIASEAPAERHRLGAAAGSC
jgi:hypothetical protein